MVNTSLVQEKRRIWWEKLDSSGKFPDGRIKVDVIFKDSKGRKFVWTARWEEVRELYLEAVRVEKMNKPKGQELPLFGQVAKETLKELKGEPEVNFKLLAVKLGERLKGHSFNEINRVAIVVFDFECISYPHPNITSVRAQAVYDWVMALANQPMSESEKLRLLRDFVNSLDPTIKLDFPTA